VTNYFLSLKLVIYEGFSCSVTGLVIIRNESNQISISETAPTLSLQY